MAASSTDVTLVETWRDTTVRFDIHPKQMEMGPGEILIDSLEEVEDTKGNNGDRGRLMVTNLRLVWFSHKRPKINLSIGHGCVLSMDIRSANSRLKGKSQALFVLTKFNDVRFQFVFTHLVANSPRLFTTVQAVHRAYTSSGTYRDVRLRSAVVQDGQLTVLPSEEIFDEWSNVWNLSNDQGTLGVMFITNLRVIWFSQANEVYNISLPFLQITEVLEKQTKFGRTLVLKTTKKAGSLTLGFRIDPEERMSEMLKKIQRLHKIYHTSPNFGVVFNTEEAPLPLEVLTLQTAADDVEIKDQITDSFAAYFAEGGARDEQLPVYSEELGLAIEPLREGVTLQSLWTVY